MGRTTDLLGSVILVPMYADIHFDDSSGQPAFYLKRDDKLHLYPDIYFSHKSGDKIKIPIEYLAEEPRRGREQCTSDIEITTTDGKVFYAKARENSEIDGVLHIYAGRPDYGKAFYAKASVLHIRAGIYPGKPCFGTGSIVSVSKNIPSEFIIVSGQKIFRGTTVYFGDKGLELLK